MKIISRQEAIVLDLKQYFTGEPCKRGHIAERRTVSGECAKCSNQRAMAWRIRRAVLDDCLICGKKFVVRGRAKTCSKICSKEKRRRQSAGRSREKITLERDRKNAREKAKRLADRIELEALREQKLHEPKTVSEAIAEIERLHALIAKQANSVEPSRIATTAFGYESRPKKAPKTRAEHRQNRPSESPPKTSESP
jgi:hypothetical protein